MTDAETLKALKDEWVANPSRRSQIQDKIDRLEEDLRIERDRFLADWDEGFKENTKFNRRKREEDQKKATALRHTSDVANRRRYRHCEEILTTGTLRDDGTRDIRWQSGYRVVRSERADKNDRESSRIGTSVDLDWIMAHQKAHKARWQYIEKEPT